MTATVSIGATVVTSTPNPTPTPATNNTIQNNSVDDSAGIFTNSSSNSQTITKKPFKPIEEPFMSTSQAEKVLIRPRQSPPPSAAEHPTELTSTKLPPAKAILATNSLPRPNAPPPRAKAAFSPRDLPVLKDAINMGTKLAKSIGNMENSTPAIYYGVSTAVTTSAAAVAPVGLFRVIKKILQLLIWK